MDFFKNLLKPAIQQPPLKDSRFLCSKTLTGVLWEGSHTWKSRVPGFQNFFTAEFSHFLVTIFLTGILIGGSHTWKSRAPGFQIPALEKSWVPGFQIPVLEKNPGYQDFKIPALEKNHGYRDFKSSTDSSVESLYNKENFPGASRPSKTFTGFLRERQSGLSLGGGCCRQKIISIVTVDFLVFGRKCPNDFDRFSACRMGKKFSAILGKHWAPKELHPPSKKATYPRNK